MIHPMNIFKKGACKLRQGFSLIEVNIAIFVLSTGALALLSLFPFGLQQSRNATNEMILSSCADRFLGAASIAAAQPGITFDEFLDNFEEISELTDVKSNSPSDSEAEDLDFKQFKNSNLYYHAWAYEEKVNQTYGPETNQSDAGGAAIVHVGVLLSLEKTAKYNDVRGASARNRAQLFATKVFLAQIEDSSVIENK